MRSSLPTTLMLLLQQLTLCAAAQVAPSVGAAAPTFTIANDQFVQDGKVVHLRAGCIHYSVRRSLPSISPTLLADLRTPAWPVAQLLVACTVIDTTASTKSFYLCAIARLTCALGAAGTTGVLGGSPAPAESHGPQLDPDVCPVELARGC